MNEVVKLSVAEICERILQPIPTLILMHRSPDGDAVGSAFALKEVFRQLKIPSECVSCDELPNRLKFLSDGQESVLPDAIPADFANARVVSVDVASAAQLGNLQEKFLPRVEWMIDHHGNGCPFAPGLIVASASASGEILVEIVDRLTQMGKVTWNCTLASCLYAAISSDTGCFRYSNVTPKTHEFAARLLKIGIDAAQINHQLLETRTLKDLVAVSAGINRLKLHLNGQFATVDFPYSLKRELQLADENLETLVDYARSVQGVKVAAAIRQPNEEGVFRVSLRSSCDYDVSALSAKFGGGGHLRASGCTIRAASIEDAVSELVSAVSENELNDL